MLNDLLKAKKSMHLKKNMVNKLKNKRWGSGVYPRKKRFCDPPIKNRGPCQTMLKCMDFLALRRSFSTKIPNFIFFWPKPFYYLPWHGFEGWFGEKVPGSGPGSRFKRAYLKKGRFWGEKVSTLRGYKMVKFWDFWAEIWYGPMILPLFLTFGKKNWSRVTFTK